MDRELANRDEALNRLLAQSPQLMDRGFSLHLQARLRRAANLKLLVFISTFALWIALAAFITTPAQILAQFRLVSDFLIRQAQALNNFSAIQQAVIEIPQSNEITLIVIVACCLAVSALGNLLRA